MSSLHGEFWYFCTFAEPQHSSGTVSLQSQADRYEVKWFGLKPPNLRQFVTFSTSDPERLPVPAPELLALHATCCKDPHLSGAAEYIDEIYRDADQIGVLSADGASGDILDYMLSSLSKQVHHHPQLYELM
ncbi:hypothetical protein J3R83DRAFT_10164 [Lanmaoa asiatica]|nr:hypothetical protein J3R83DRAFT_10164 [Lanmaoa asiatica]